MSPDTRTESVMISVPMDDFVLYTAATERDDTDVTTALLRHVRAVADAERARRRRASIAAYNDRQDRPTVDPDTVLADLRAARDAS